jgi:hypothetical protein
MTIRTPALVLTGVLTLLIGACGAAPSADAEGVSPTLASPPVSTLATPEDSQRLNPAATLIGICHGKCCNFVCGTGLLHSVSRECETCNPYATGYCEGKGGVEETWWGNCH